MLRLALEKIDLLPPNRVTDDTSILTLKSLIFEPLLRWQNGFAAPGLFDHWQHTPDGRRWQFFIRSGAIFHDGHACTADDVISFILAILDSVDMFGMKWSYSRYLALARFTIGRDNSVIFENPEPMAAILDIFSEFFVSRRDPDGVASLGTGPYRVAAFVAGQTLRLERVAAGPGPAVIIAQAVTDADERLRQVADGAVDVALNLERTETPLRRSSTLFWGESVTTLSVMAYLNCFDGLFATPAARLAINHAIDVQVVIDEAMHGLGVRSSTVVSAHHLGMRAARLQPIAYDPAHAKALLDQAGGPSDLVLRTPTAMPDHALAISRHVADQLAQVGLSVTLDVEPNRPDYARQVGNKTIGDIALFDSSPHSTYRVLDDKISSRSRGVWWQGYDDPQAQALIDTAASRVGDAEREAAYAACLSYLHDHPPWLYLCHPISVFAAPPDLSGLCLSPKGVLILT